MRVNVITQTLKMPQEAARGFGDELALLSKVFHCGNSVYIWIFCGLYFPRFKLNTEIHSVLG